MRNSPWVMMKNLLRTGSEINTIRYEKDKKKRSRAVGAIIAKAVLFMMLLAFCALISFGYGSVGFINAIPVWCGITISVISFVVTILKTNGFMFAFKEYDMTMSLPFKVRDVAVSRFILMYVTNSPWYVGISLATLAAYGYYAHPGAAVYVIWIVLSLLLPVIPMLIAVAVGTLIAGVGAGFRHKQTVQTVLTFIFIIGILGLEFCLKEPENEQDIEAILAVLSNIGDMTKSIYLPAGWFYEAVTEYRILSVCLLPACSILLFELFFFIIAKVYRRINSRLMAGAARKNYKMQAQKSRSVIKSVAFKEFKRFTGSTLYITNMGVGQILLVILCVMAFVIGPDAIAAEIFAGNSSIPREMIITVIPMLVYLIDNVMITTTCSLSLEGNNFWILQSLPIDMLDVLKGKMLFNMCLTLPFAAAADICLGIAFKAGLPNIVLFLFLSSVQCSFATVWGMRCNLKHLKLDWANEIEVIKQGTAGAAYMFPNMLGGIILMLAAGIFSGTLGTAPVLLLLIAFMGLLTWLAALSLRKLVRKI